MPAYSMKQLVKASGFPERSIRRYVQEGMLPSTPYRGKDTVYGDEHLVRLAAIWNLQASGVSRVAQLKARMAAWEREQAAQREAAEALANAPSPEPAPAPPIAPPTPKPSPLPGARFRHVPLLPGMELVVRDDASDLVNRLAAEIHAKYATSVLTDAPSLGDPHGDSHL